MISSIFWRWYRQYSEDDIVNILKMISSIFWRWYRQYSEVDIVNILKMISSIFWRWYRQYSEDDIVNILKMISSIFWRWYRQHDWVFNWQHICYILWTCFSTDSRHSCGYQLCSSSRQLIPLSLLCRLHRGALEKNKMKLTRTFDFTFCHIDDVLSLNNSMFILIASIPLIEKHIRLGLLYTQRNGQWEPTKNETDDKEMISIYM
jgi:hypothetical protein